MALRTRNPHVPLTLRYADILAAARASEVLVSRPVGESSRTYADESPDFLRLPQIPVILCRTLCIISGKHAEVNVQEQDPDNTLKNGVPENKGCHNQNQKNSHQESPKIIGAVASDHKIAESVAYTTKKIFHKKSPVFKSVNKVRLCVTKI